MWGTQKTQFQIMDHIWSASKIPDHFRGVPDELDVPGYFSVASVREV